MINASYTLAYNTQASVSSCLPTKLFAQWCFGRFSSYHLCNLIAIFVSFPRIFILVIHIAYQTVFFKVNPINMGNLVHETIILVPPDLNAGSINLSI